MVVGLGTGTTAKLVIDALGERVRQGLRIVGIPTSDQSAQQARDLGIPLTDLGEHPAIDLTLDGADEVEQGTLHLIKGRGGALLHEKIVASASNRLLIVVDESKLVTGLGIRSALPIEVIPFGWQTVSLRLQHMGANPRLRLADDNSPFITDSGHHILDCVFGRIPSPLDLAGHLDHFVGLVEHGLFLGMASEVIVGGAEGITVLQRAGFPASS
jgi:ribose 5-phosphate isomerase A